MCVSEYSEENYILKIKHPFGLHGHLLSNSIFFHRSPRECKSTCNIPVMFWYILHIICHILYFSLDIECGIPEAFCPQHQYYLLLPTDPAYIRAENRYNFIQKKFRCCFRYITILGKTHQSS